MNILQSLHFLRPEWFLALIPTIGMLLLALRRSGQSQSWAKICDSTLLPHILTSSSRQRGMLELALIAIASIVAITAAAGPVWEKLPQPIYRDQSALVIALDLSQSMDANDIKPSRLSRARLKVLDILELRETGQTALLVFAQEAFVVSPLTEDSATIRNLIPTLETAIMPAQGSNALSAVQRATELFRQAGVNAGHIILLTDGIREDHIGPMDELVSGHHRLSVLGIGTEDGAPIPLQGGFLTDRDGAIVIPKLDTDTLRKAALAGSGLYSQMSTDDSDIRYLLQTLDTRVDMNANEQDVSADVWREEGPWLLLLVIPLAALLARRGWLAIALIFVLPAPQPAYAFDIIDLWQTKDQQAMRAFEAGDTTTASQKFQDEEWRASALYREGDYQGAIDALPEPSSSDAHYNKANALARIGDLRSALDSYERALDIDPDNEDALYNRQLVEDALEQQQRAEAPDDSQEGGEQERGDQQQEQEADTQQGEESESENTSQQKSPEDSESMSSDQQDAAEGSDDSQQAQGEQASDEQQSEETKQQGQTELDEAQHAREDADAQKQASNLEQLDDDAEEQARATERWLQRIEDDPGGLLRRKFLYQYRQQEGRSSSDQPW